MLPASTGFYLVLPSFPYFYPVLLCLNWVQNVILFCLFFFGFWFRFCSSFSFSYLFFFCISARDWCGEIKIGREASANEKRRHVGQSQRFGRDPFLETATSIEFNYSCAVSWCRRISPRSISFYRGLARFYWVFLGFPGFYWVLLGFT